MPNIQASVTLTNVSDANFIEILKARDANAAIAVTQAQLGQVAGQPRPGPGFTQVMLQTGSAAGLTALAELVARLT